MMLQYLQRDNTVYYDPGYLYQYQDLFDQVREGCKFFSGVHCGVLRISGLFLDIMEDSRYQSLYSRPDELEMYNYRLIYIRRSIAFQHIINLCMQYLRPVDSNSIFAEAYWVLCDYLLQRHGWDCSGSIQREEIKRYMPLVSTATYYHRLNLAIAMLAQHISLFLECFTGHLEPVHLPVYNRELVSLRELEVLRLAAQGINGTQDAADRLGVSKATITTYWKRIRAKLGARNRTEALVIANCLGIIKI